MPFCTHMCAKFCYGKTKLYALFVTMFLRMLTFTLYRPLCGKLSLLECKFVCVHCNKKWAKRSFPLENNPPEEGKFPCGYWNIFPVTHTVFIHSSVREKCSRLWTGTFYRSKKVNFLELSFLKIFLENFRIPCFSRTFPENSHIPVGRMF